jgi:hypothetical protein
VKRECPCGFHAFTQEHLLLECPYTEVWRESIELKKSHEPDNGMCQTPAIIIRLKGIWKTTGLSWKEQAKVKRKIIGPVGDFAKGWHQE